MNPAVEAATPKACPSCGKRYPADALFCSFDGCPLTTTPGAIAAAAATDAYVGREISGHIELRKLVGIGAMGRVYQAFQKGTDRDVAVKILHRELSANQALVTRFHREAKVASRLAHPNVVHVIMTGQLPDGAMYIVMEYLDGLSLQSALLAAGGAMPLPRALHIALQVCEAAGEAHAQGVVHRDLKPENVMLVKRSGDPDYVKVLDFGIARLNWGEQSMATAAGLIFGTARYISPEGAQGEKVGPAGDVYSIATMVYQMLAGRTPFDADQAVALLVQQIHDAPRPLGTIERAAYVPDRIAAVVMQNLAKRPEERADGARHFARMLLEAAVESGLSAQDILSHPAMLSGARGGHPSAVQMPSVLRTKQLQLGPGDTARLAEAPPGSEGPRRHGTAIETPLPPSSSGRTELRTEVPDAASQPTGSATTRWTSSHELQAKMAPSAPRSGVDLTMDEQQQGLPARVTAASPSSVFSSLEQAGPTSAGAPVSSHRFPALETTLADEGADIAVARRPERVHPLGLVVGCFLLGAVAMALVGYRSGLFGGHPAQAQRPVPSPVTIASEGIEEPPTLGPLPSAVSSSGTSIPPLAPAHPTTNVVANAARALIEVSNAKPAVGEPVDLEGHFAGSPRPHVEGARFHISGPGIAPGTDVSAVDDGSGVYRASFTFLQAGRFEVEFGARADGAPARTSRVLLVGDDHAAPPAAASSSNTGPVAPAAPSDTAKWM